MTTPASAREVFFSFPEVVDPARHRDYNAWHQLDHQPENRALPGVLHGDRWVRSPDCRAAGQGPDPLLDVAQYVAMYWFADPLEQSLAEWKALGNTTYHAGRRPELAWTRRTLLGWFRPTASAVRPDIGITVAALPFRAHRGVHLTVSRVDDGETAEAHELFEFHHRVRLPQLLQWPGVSGWYTFSGRRIHRADGSAPGGTYRVTLIFLESDPVEFAERLATAEADGSLARAPERPGLEQILLSTPLRTIVPWEWDWFEPSAP